MKGRRIVEKVEGRKAECGRRMKVREGKLGRSEFGSRNAEVGKRKAERKAGLSKKNYGLAQK